MTYDQLNTRPLQEQMATQFEITQEGVSNFAAGLSAEMATEHPDVAASVNSYLSLLERGGKRTRGVLTVTGYNMYGGNNRETAATAAGVVEAMHAYLLVMDDVADASDLRRGDPTAHIQMRDHFAAAGVAVEPGKLGADVGQTAALYAQHKAQTELMGVNAPAENRLLALQVLNDGLARTGVGQVLDILAPARTDFGIDDILKVAEYKTAYYSFLLPLQVGAALAGAPREEMETFAGYSRAAGLAFQLRVDVVGIFSDEAVTGKSRMGDIIEGKKTLLMHRALELADDRQHVVLLEAIGNPDLTPGHFAECLDIIQNTGALKEVEQLIETYGNQACDAIDNLETSFDPAYLQLLRNMALYGARRNA
jgi:geranylgeranyl diphosphate synthase type I